MGPVGDSDHPTPDHNLKVTSNMAKNNFTESDQSALDGSHFVPSELLTEGGTIVRVRADETDEEVTQEMCRLALLGTPCIYMPTREIAEEYIKQLDWHTAVHKAGVKALQAQEGRRLRRLGRTAEAAL